MRKIQFGCGNHRLNGWQNHDADVDIRHPLPFSDSSVDFILAEHVLEHVTTHEGYRFLEECHRIISPGGVVRIVVPSVEVLYQRFTPDYGEFVKRNGWGDGSLRSAVSALVHHHGHLALWTGGSLFAIMSSLGFECEYSIPDHSRHAELNGVDGHGAVIGILNNASEAVVVEGTKKRAPISAGMRDANSTSTKMGYGFITVERPEHYIRTTLADFFSVEPDANVDVFVGSASDKYLDFCRADPRVKIHALSAAEWKTISSWTLGRKCSYNHWRAMEYYSRQGRAACIFEDDVIFCKNLCKRVQEALDEIEFLHSRYVLTLYSPHDLTKDRSLDRGKYYSSYHAPGFYGTQGVYYPASMLPDLTHYFRRFAVDEPRAPADLVIKDYCIAGNFLYGTRWSLVQHIGKNTTGLAGCGFHCAPKFDKNYDPNQGHVVATHNGNVNGDNRNGLDFDEINAKLEVILKGMAGSPTRFAGRGIVIAGGGYRYFTCAWVALRMLRKLDCTLPVELWHLGDAEMTEAMRRLVEPLGVRTVDALELRKRFPARILNGWELKPYSIIHSAFEEVLYLDADNVPVVDPSFLFSTEPYRKTGSIFWPDFGRLSPDKEIWEICDVAYRDESEFESGQIVINKSRCWKALLVTMLMNEYSDFFYKYIHGDKETFHMAWRILEQAYSMIPHSIFRLDGTMCQHDFQKRRVFQHRNCLKWSLTEANAHVPGFLYESDCLAFLAELAEKWPESNRKLLGERR